MPSITVSVENYRRFMEHVSSIFPPDVVMARLLDLAAAAVSPPPRDADRVARGPLEDDLGDPDEDSDALYDGSGNVIDDEGGGDFPRAVRGESLSRFIYYKTILLLLAESGGSDRASSVKKRLLSHLRAQMREVDLAPLPKNSREPRWWNHARFGREWLVERGFIHRNAGHGVWRLTPGGRDMARKLARNFDDPDFPGN